MKIQVMSDLHLEFHPDTIPEISNEADVLVYAGDVSSDMELLVPYFEDVREQTKVPIVYVLGNHEFYGKFLHNVSDYRESLKHIPNIHILEKDVFIYKNVRFIGTTMWTDFDGERGCISAQFGMNDFQTIRKVRDDYSIGLVDVIDILSEHRRCREFLYESLESAKSYPDESVVVVTHHGPSFYCVDEEYKNSALNGAFFVELSGLILDKSPDVWVYGHTHKPKQLSIGSTRLICNPRCYPNEGNYDPTPVLIEVLREKA